MFDFLKSLLGVTAVLANKVQGDQLYNEAKALYDATEFKKALPPMREAAEKGNPHAAVHLGIMHMQGLGVPADWTKAATCFEAAIALKVPSVKVNLGMIHAIGGYGLRRDLEKAKSLLQEAAEQENDNKAADMLKMVTRKEGIFGMKETARPRIAWK